MTMQQTSQWEDISPAEAAAYLEHAQTLRPQTVGTVEMYKRDMLSSSWFRTHQGLAFADIDGRETLIDGGNRMKALALAGEADPDLKVAFWVTRHVDPGAFQGFDIGRARSTSNMVQAWYPGFPYYKNAGTIGRRGIAYLSGRPWSRLNASKHELHEFIDAHPTILAAAEYAAGWRMPRATLPASAAGFAYWVFTHIDPDDGATFMDQLATGIGLEARNPVLVLRNRLLGSDYGRGAPVYVAYSLRVRGREPEVALALTVSAWNKWRAGEQVAKLQLPKGQLLSDENFPVPSELRRWTDPRGLMKG